MRNFRLKLCTSKYIVWNLWQKPIAYIALKRVYFVFHSKLDGQLFGPVIFFLLYSHIQFKTKLKQRKVLALVSF
jgi:hypothetical protein